MLQYLIILLDNTSTSFCHYSVSGKKRQLISLENLKKGILFAMKENLTIQFVFPDYELPYEYYRLIETIDHVKIKPDSANDIDADIIVLNGISKLTGANLKKRLTYVLRISKSDFNSNVDTITETLKKVSRLNIVITDIESFGDNDFCTYKDTLERLIRNIEELYVKDYSPQINLITDRLVLRQMNNCNAGDSTITLAPNGKFYPCPAFLYESAESKFMGLGGPEDAPFSIGDLETGLDIKNPQLYKIDHAPICQVCDAFQCKRCAWLNWKLTRETNTPSHEQCVLAHLARNASRQLLETLRKQGDFLPDQDIKEIDYLDPFDSIDYWR